MTDDEHEPDERGPAFPGSATAAALVLTPAGGALVGYGRVSTRDQHLDRQLTELTAMGCVRVFADKASGRGVDRPELWACLDYVRPGDVLVVVSLDRLGRSLDDLLAIVAGLRKRGVGLRSLHESIDTTTAGGRLDVHVFAALAQFLRELIVEGTRDGLAAARARGQRLGRPPTLTPEQVQHARDLLTNPANSIASIARLLGVSRATIHAHVPEAAHGRAALISATRRQRSPPTALSPSRRSARVTRMSSCGGSALPPRRRSHSNRQRTPNFNLPDRFESKLFSPVSFRASHSWSINLVTGCILHSAMRAQSVRCIGYSAPNESHSSDRLVAPIEPGREHEPVASSRGLIPLRVQKQPPRPQDRAETFRELSAQVRPHPRIRNS